MCTGNADLVRRVNDANAKNRAGKASRQSHLQQCRQTVVISRQLAELLPISTPLGTNGYIAGLDVIDAGRGAAIGWGRSLVLQVIARYGVGIEQCRSGNTATTGKRDRGGPIPPALIRAGRRR